MRLESESKDGCRLGLFHQRCAIWVTVEAMVCRRVLSSCRAVGSCFGAIRQVGPCGQSQREASWCNVQGEGRRQEGTGRREIRGTGQSLAVWAREKQAQRQD